MDERHDWTLTDALDHETGRGDPFAAAVRSTRMPMIITNPRLPDNPIVFANEASQKLTGYDRSEMIGQNCRLLQGPESDPDTIAQIRDAVERGTDIAVDLLNYRKDGSAFWNALYISPVRDSRGEIQFFFASQVDITDRIDRHARIAREKARIEAEVARRVAELRESLEAQKLLLHEVDHRVKNNMTMIGSILRLQMREADDPRTIALLHKMMSRIDALATVHRHLYQSDDVTRFDIGAYAITLVRDLVQTNAEREIRIRADLGRAEVPAGQASAIGLIVNEVLTSLLRPEAELSWDGSITISAQTQGHKVQLTIEAELSSDDQLAAPSGLDEMVVKRLAGQSHSHVTWTRTDGGARVDITALREAP